MRLIKEPNKLKKVIEPTPMSQAEIDDISTTLLQELTRYVELDYQQIK